MENRIGLDLIFGVLTVEVDVWIHQNKLIEGLDDQRLCVAAVLHRIRNDRKLIQTRTPAESLDVSSRMSGVRVLQRP